MKTSLAMAAFLGCFVSAQAQPTNSFPLWPDGAPGALGNADKDIPTLTPYWPDPAKATGDRVGGAVGSDICCNLGRVRHASDSSLRSIFALAFIIRIEECLVFDDRAAQGATKLVVVEWAL